VAAAVSYRFAPANPWPAQILDVKAAVRFLRAHAVEHGIDPERFGAIGFSAGGHLAMMLGSADPGDGLEGDAAKDAPPSKVQAVVSWFGPTDLDAEDIPATSKPLVEKLLGPGARAAPGKGDASPMHYVGRGDAPMLLFHGTKDPIVPVTQATRMAESLTAAGVRGEVHLMLGQGHGWMGTTLATTLEDSIRWFDLTLKGVVPPVPRPR
jgi:acetyl esterase/lipase